MKFLTLFTFFLRKIIITHSLESLRNFSIVNLQTVVAWLGLLYEEQSVCPLRSVVIITRLGPYGNVLFVKHEFASSACTGFRDISNYHETITQNKH